MSINRATITGNLTRDSELVKTSAGGDLLRFSVAVNDRVRNQQSGEWEDRANYIDCVCFGKRATSLSRFLKKGTKVAIDGRLHWSQWKDKESGKNRSSINVTVDDVEFMSRGDDTANGGAGVAAQSQAQATQPERHPAEQASDTDQYDSFDEDDDIPF